MFRTLLLRLVLSLALAEVCADDKAPDLSVPTVVAGVQGPQLARVLQHPNDAKALKSLLDTVGREIRQQNYVFQDWQTAERGQLEVTALLAQLQPTVADAQAELERGKRDLQSRAKLISIVRAKRADLEAALSVNPDNYDVFSLWQLKHRQELYRVLYLDVPAAEKMLTSGKAFAEKVGAATRNDLVKNGVRVMLSSGADLGDADQRLAEARTLLATVGQEAPAVEARTWVGGPPITPADWRGKVVLLHTWRLPSDFYKVDILHLSQWQARYGGRGLMLISVVRDSYLAWNEEEQRIEFSGSAAPTFAADFDAALRKMIGHDKLQHHFALGGGESAERRTDILERHGGLKVIDREGKIRIIRVAPRDAEFREVGNLLAELCNPVAEK